MYIRVPMYSTCIYLCVCGHLHMNVCVFVVCGSVYVCEYLCIHEYLCV